MTTRQDHHRFDPERVRELGRIDLLADALADGVRQGLRRSRRQGESSEFSDFKPYAPGDDVRFLDWRVFARSSRLFVRRYESETDLETLLVLDATASMAWRWKDTVTKLEYGANLLAAHGCLAVLRQDPVGLLVHDAKRLHHLQPRCSRSQLDAMYAVLDAVEPGGADTFSRLVDAIGAHRHHRTCLIVCSDLEENEDDVARGLEKLGGTEDRVWLYHLLDQAEETLPFSGITLLEDSETGARLPVDLPAARKRHAQTIRAFRETWRQHCEHWGLRYRPVHTGMNYLDVLLRTAEG